MSRLAATALLLVLTAPPVGAQTWERKLARGLAGVTLGVLEVPGNMVVESQARGPGEGLPFGFIKGLGMIVVRELVGVYEFVTTPVPAPEDFRPILRPEFPWEYFVEDAGTEPEPPPAVRG